MREHTGPYRTIRDNAGSFRAIHAICFYTMPYMRPDRPYGAIWGHNIHTGPPLGILGHTEPYRAIWDHMIHTGPHGVIKVHTAPYSVIQDPMGPYWTMHDHTGSYWTMWDHIATSSEAINLAEYIIFRSHFWGTYPLGLIVSLGTLLPGHIVSRGALSPGAHCLRGTLSPGAHCLPGHIVSGVHCLRGILSWRHIVSGRVVSGA